MNFQLRLGVPFDDIRRALSNGPPQRVEDIIESHSRRHPLVYTHSDLAQHNIMVDNGQVTGIMDCECSGWYTSHWEYLKALFTEPCDIEWRMGIHDFLTPFQFEANVDAGFGWGSPKLEIVIRCASQLSEHTVAYIIPSTTHFRNVHDAVEDLFHDSRVICFSSVDGRNDRIIIVHHHHHHITRHCPL